MIREPFIVDYLLSKPKIQNKMIKFMVDNFEREKTEGSSNSSVRGYLFEHMILLSMVSKKSPNKNWTKHWQRVNAAKYFKTVASLPAWIKQGSFNWKYVSTVQTVMNVSNAVKLLKTQTSKLQNYNKLPKNQQVELLASLQSNSFLNQHPQIAKGELPTELLATLVDIVNLKLVPHDKRNELLFFVIQPLDLIIRPTTHLGPDGVGFFGMNSLSTTMQG